MAPPTTQLSPEALAATATAWIDALGSLDLDRLRSLMSAKYQHAFAPGTLELAGATKDFDAMLAHAARAGAVMNSFRVFPRQVWPNPHLRQVVVWADSKAEFKEEAKKGGDNGEGWDYAGEYIFVITVNEEGDKVENVLEFLDSKATERVLGMIARAFKNIQG